MVERRFDFSPVGITPLGVDAFTMRSGPRETLKTRRGSSPGSHPCRASGTPGWATTPGEICALRSGQMLIGSVNVLGLRMSLGARSRRNSRPIRGDAAQRKLRGSSPSAVRDGRAKPESLIELVTFGDLALLANRSERRIPQAPSGVPGPGGREPRSRTWARDPRGTAIGGLPLGSAIAYGGPMTEGHRGDVASRRTRLQHSSAALHCSTCVRPRRSGNSSSTRPRR